MRGGTVVGAVSRNFLLFAPQATSDEHRFAQVMQNPSRDSDVMGIMGEDGAE